MRDGDRGREGDPAPTAELRGIAHGQRRRHAQHDTMNTTALVHEAYIKLVGSEAHGFRNRAHFLAIAATAMRQILIDYARQQSAAKRGGGEAVLSFEAIEAAVESETGFSENRALALLALDRALTRLRQHEERQSRVAECRIFGGMTVEEVAEALGISTATVKREWQVAAAQIWRELDAPRESAGPAAPETR